METKPVIDASANAPSPSRSPGAVDISRDEKQVTPPQKTPSTKKASVSPGAELRATVEIPIPQGMRSQIESDPKALAPFIDAIRSSVKSVTVEMRPDCIIVKSPLQESLRRVEVLHDILNENMRQWLNLRRQVTGGANNRTPVYYEEFPISQARMAQAIGPKGSNINAARRIDGVEKINNNDRFVQTQGYYLFQIRARTPEAAKEAREMLESNTLTVKVPRDMAGRVIGSQGSNIQMIVDKSGVTRVSIDAESSIGDSNDVHFVFYGTGAPLLDAKLMVSFVVDSAKRMDVVRREYFEQGSAGSPGSSKDNRHDGITNGHHNGHHNGYQHQLRSSGGRLGGDRH